MLSAIVATSGLSLVLFLTGLFVLFTPLPVIFTVLRKGAGAAAAATGAALILLYLLYRLPSEPLGVLPMMVFYPSLSLKVVTGLSLVTFAYYLGIGWIVALASRRRGRWASMERASALMTLAALAVPAVGLLILGRATSSSFGSLGNLAREVTGALTGLFQKMIDLQQSAGFHEEDLAFLRQSAPRIVSSFLQILPSLWIDLTLMVLSLNILFLRRWTAEGRPFPEWSEFGLWRLGERWIWGPIAAGAVYFANIYLFQSRGAGIVALNVLTVFGAVYLLQGLAVISFFFRSKLSPIMRLAAYALILIFFQFAWVVVIAVGLFDFWFDFRKLKKIT